MLPCWADARKVGEKAGGASWVNVRSGPRLFIRKGNRRHWQSSKECTWPRSQTVLCQVSICWRRAHATEVGPANLEVTYCMLAYRLLSIKQCAKLVSGSQEIALQSNCNACRRCIQAYSWRRGLLEVKVKRSNQTIHLPCTQTALAAIVPLCKLKYMWQIHFLCLQAVDRHISWPPDSL